MIKSIKSKYKHVQGLQNDKSDKVYWVIHKKGVGKNHFNTEREAAIAVDKMLIRKGEEPVNVLKRK